MTVRFALVDLSAPDRPGCRGLFATRRAAHRMARLLGLRAYQVRAVEVPRSACACRPARPARPRPLAGSIGQASRRAEVRPARLFGT